MKDENEIKKFILEALDLIPEDVARIDLSVQLRGNVGNVKLSFVPPDRTATHARCPACPHMAPLSADGRIIMAHEIEPGTKCNGEGHTPWTRR